eukprot:m.415041 g.415041  ORF g.415041 m.415041 type:complete len:293 (-) comp29513_c0_seq1:123-1001(-)
MSFLPTNPEADVGVMLKVLGPLYSRTPDGSVKIEEFLKSGADLSSIKAMLASIGLIRVAADGTVSEISPAEAAAAAAAAADSRSSGPLFDVPTKVMKSVQAALEKQEAAYQAMLAAAGGPPAVGTQCKRKNCKNRYEGEESNDVECTFCPGEPVFHEGYKYWSCCDKKKSLDFDEFLNLPGCKTAERCMWFDEESDEAVEKPVRMDHFESGRDFVMSFFTKCAEPSKTEIKVNEDTLTISTTYERNCTFTKSFHLKGTIDPDRCTATIMTAKIDVKLMKTSGERWDGLEAAE